MTPVLAADPPGLSLTDDMTPVPFGTTENAVPFVPGMTEYTVSVENDVESVTVSATPNDGPGATVEITPADQDTSEEATGHQVYLTPGTNTVITATVTAENGSKNTYTVTVIPQEGNSIHRCYSVGVESCRNEPVARFRPRENRIRCQSALRRQDGDRSGQCRGCIGALVPDVDTNDEDPDNVSIVDATDRVVTLAGVGHDTDITVTVTPEAGAGTDNVNIKTYSNHGLPREWASVAMTTPHWQLIPRA